MLEDVKSDLVSSRQRCESLQKRADQLPIVQEELDRAVVETQQKQKRIDLFERRVQTEKDAVEKRFQEERAIVKMLFIPRTTVSKEYTPNKDLLVKTEEFVKTLRQKSAGNLVCERKLAEYSEHNANLTEQLRHATETIVKLRKDEQTAREKTSTDRECERRLAEQTEHTANLTTQWLEAKKTIEDLQRGANAALEKDTTIAFLQKQLDTMKQKLAQMLDTREKWVKLQDETRQRMIREEELEWDAIVPTNNKRQRAAYEGTH
jgi:hypothetical protein